MILETIQMIVVLLVAVILHEYSHGWVAYRLGDPTAKMMGRLTLNPLRHIDPMGSIAVPFLLKMAHLPPFGWAKPVPVDFRRLRNPKIDMIWVAMAGPLTNIALAAFFGLLLKFVPLAEQGQHFLSLGIVINLFLAFFNLVPIPPLDGSRVVMGLLPNQVARFYSQLEPFGFIIVLVLLNFGMLDFVWELVSFVMGKWGLSLNA